MCVSAPRFCLHGGCLRLEPRFSLPFPCHFNAFSFNASRQGLLCLGITSIWVSRENTPKGCVHLELFIPRLLTLGGILNWDPKNRPPWGCDCSWQALQSTGHPPPWGGCLGCRPHCKGRPARNVYYTAEAGRRHRDILSVALLGGPPVGGGGCWLVFFARTPQSLVAVSGHLSQRVSMKPSGPERSQQGVRGFLATQHVALGQKFSSDAANKQIRPDE